jgi:hypothetical protein
MISQMPARRVIWKRDRFGNQASSVEIDEITTHSLHPLTIGCRVAEVKKLIVTGVR